MDHRTLINMGRKAGLNTSELYQALTGRRPEAGERQDLGADTNGFSARIGQGGRCIYLPHPGKRE